MQNAFLVIKSSVSPRFRLILIVALAVVVAVLGPFGTFDALSFVARFCYWFVVLILADVFVRITLMLVDRFAAGRTKAVRLAMAAVVFTAAYSPAIWMLSALVDKDLLQWSGFLLFVVNIAAITCTLALTVFFLTGDAQAEAPRRASLYDRLPVVTEAAIMRLTVDDHYVEVFLDDGTSHRVLMRLADAIREMDGAAGFCTHRSHWVSAVHISGSGREQKREYVLLSDGTKVPVSKTYRENVVAAGFL